MVLTAQQFEALMPDATQLESDEPEIESSQHYMQLMLLVSCLEWLWRSRNDYFIGANLTIYYSRQQLKTRDFRGPDFFLVKQTQKRHRKSWVIWEEDGKYPNLIIELLSDSTARNDRNLKKELYQNNFRTTEYFWFYPDTLEFIGWRLVEDEYREIQPDNRGWRWSSELGLFLGVDGSQLRYFSPTGQLIPTPQEAAIQEQLQTRQERKLARRAQLQVRQERELAREADERAREADERAREERELAREADQRARDAQLQAQQERELAQQAQLQAEQADERAREADERAERLARRLRALGIDPDSVN